MSHQSGNDKHLIVDVNVDDSSDEDDDSTPPVKGLESVQVDGKWFYQVRFEGQRYQPKRSAKNKSFLKRQKNMKVKRVHLDKTFWKNVRKAVLTQLAENGKGPQNK